MQKMIEKNIPSTDDFFIGLEKIIFPIAGKKFEKLAIVITKFIAHEYGATVLLYHVGSDDKKPIFDELIGLLKSVKVKVTFENEPPKKGMTIPQMIIRRYEKEAFQLMIIPSKRRSKRIDKFLWNSVSAKVIPNIGIDVLQVYAKKKVPDEIVLNDIGCLIPFSRRDPYLLRWAASIITSKIGTNPLIAYHVDEYPSVTPSEFVTKDPDYLKHKADFEKRMKYYSERYSVEMKTQMVIGKTMEKTLGQALNKDNLDLVIMGATKLPPKFHFGRTMSERLIDQLKCGVMIHHWRVSHRNTNKLPK